MLHIFSSNVLSEIGSRPLPVLFFESTYKVRSSVGSAESRSRSFLNCAVSLFSIDKASSYPSSLFWRFCILWWYLALISFLLCFSMSSHVCSVSILAWLVLIHRFECFWPFLSLEPFIRTFLKPFILSRIPSQRFFRVSFSLKTFETMLDLGKKNVSNRGLLEDDILLEMVKCVLMGVRPLQCWYIGTEESVELALAPAKLFDGSHVDERTPTYSYRRWLSFVSPHPLAVDALACSVVAVPALWHAAGYWLPLRYCLSEG